MEISVNGWDRVAIGLAQYCGVDCETATPVLAAVFEAQNESRLRRWLGVCYLGGEKLVTLSARGGLIFKVFCAYSKISPPSSLDHVYCWKRGGGTYFREGTVLLELGYKLVSTISLVWCWHVKSNLNPNRLLVLSMGLMFLPFLKPLAEARCLLYS